jgi:serine/threonine protein kinase
METQDCPLNEQIDQYLIGQLSSEEIIRLEQHFDRCQVCSDTIRGMASSADDTFSGELKSIVGSHGKSPDFRSSEAFDPNSTNDEPLIQKLVQRIKADSPTELAIRSRMKEDRAAEVLWLIGNSEDEEWLGSLGHYRLIELLGAGSTGAVFSAMDTRLHREVAIKILRPSLGETARERFLKEAQAAAGFQHDNIVTVFDVGQVEGLVYMTMQLLPGETLEDRLEKVTFLAEPEARKIAQQICCALQAAHARGIIHRDLKPANIWIDTERDQIKLLDFGLARVADADPHLTASGILAGTPNFMSPEQSRGLELDGRSDLFSLGCLLYRCITGRLPFNSTGILSTLQAIQNDHPIAPSILNPACSADLSALIMALLEKQPDSRPVSATDVIEALSSPREKWRFKTTDLLSPFAEPKVFNRRSSQIRWRPFIACGLVALLGWFGWVFATDIVRIVTNQGEITIESDDKQIKIEVLQNGDLVRVIDLATSDRIDLLAGEYHIQPGREGGEFSVSPNVISLSRGGKQIVRVTRSDRAASLGDGSLRGTDTRMKQLLDDPEALQKAKDLLTLDARMEDPRLRQATEERAAKFFKAMAFERTRADKEFEQKFGVNWSEFKPVFEQWKEETINSYLNPQPPAEIANDDSQNPTYNGRTFDEWLSVVMTERNVDTLQDGIVALGELSVESPELRQLALQRITIFARRYGSWYIGGDAIKDKIHDALLRFFQSSSPSEIAEFIRQELKSGNENSREFLFWISSPGSLQLTDPKRFKAMEQTFCEQAESIIQAWIDAINNAASAHDKAMVETLNRVGRSTNYWTIDPDATPFRLNIGANDQVPPKPQGSAIDRVFRAWQEATETLAKNCFLMFLLHADVDDIRLYQHFQQRLLDENTSFDEVHALLRLLMVSGGTRFPEIVLPALIDFGTRLSERRLKSPNLGFSHPNSNHSVFTLSMNKQNTLITFSSRGLTLSIQSGFGRNVQNVLQASDADGMFLSSVELIGEYKSLPKELAEQAIHWLESQKERVDQSELTALLSQPDLDVSKLSDPDKKMLIQHILNLQIQLAIDSLKGNVEPDGGITPDRDADTVP